MSAEGLPPTLTVTIPVAPFPESSPNFRGHWKRRHYAARAAKAAAFYAALDQSKLGYLPLEGSIRLDWRVAWGKGRKRMDADNLIATLKPMADGIAEFLGVDDGRFVIGTVDQERDPEGLGFTVVTIGGDDR